MWSGVVKFENYCYKPKEALTSFHVAKNLADPLRSHEGGNILPS